MGHGASFELIDDPEDDDEDDRNLTQWLFDVVVIPTFTLALISLCLCVALGAIYGSLFFASLIYPML